MDFALIAIIGVCCVTVVEVFAPKLGVAAPLVLVLVGVAVSIAPGVPTIDIEPEWILAGVLPPLLYSAAVSMPAMDFRRDLRAISGLSVVLVVVSSLVLGVFLAWAIDGIDLATGIALGAIISPTDAVATSIARRLGVPPRVITVLDGESLLNDATALVLLRSAIAATGAVLAVVGDFVGAVLIAVVIGFAVGWLNLKVRARVEDAAVSTAISFVVPFVAYLPVEHLGGSGLVAAVTAGLFTGQGAPRYLPPRHRLAEDQNWRTVELLLEGAIFLVMGLQLHGIVEDVHGEHGGATTALGIAAAAAFLVVAVRTAYVVPLLVGLHKRAERVAARRSHIEELGTKLDSGALAPPRQPRNEREAEHFEENVARRTEMMRTRIRRGLADIDYLAGAPMGVREGVVLVWAGMRGAVTVAAAQTLPDDTPQRSLLVLIAFTVAAGTLLVQGGTLPWLVRRLGLAGGGPVADDPDRLPLLQLLSDAAESTLDDPELRRRDGTAYDPSVLRQMRRRNVLPTEAEDLEAARELGDQYVDLRLRVIGAMRESLLEARADGVYASATMESALRILDAEQITTELRGGRLEE